MQEVLKEGRLLRDRMAKEAASRDGYQNNTEGFEWEDEHMRQAKPGQE